MISNEIAQVRLRYKKPDESKSRLIQSIIKLSEIQDNLDDTSDNFRFASAVAAFGQWLKDDKYLEQFDLADVVRQANSAKGVDPFAYRAGFIRLVRIAENLNTSSHAGSWRRGREG